MRLSATDCPSLFSHMLVLSRMHPSEAKLPMMFPRKSGRLPGVNRMTPSNFPSSGTVESWASVSARSFSREPSSMKGLSSLSV